MLDQRGRIHQLANWEGEILLCFRFFWNRVFRWHSAENILLQKLFSCTRYQMWFHQKKRRRIFFLKSDQTKCFDPQSIWVIHSRYVCSPVACASFIHGHDELKNVQGQNMVVDEKNNHESMAHRAMSRGKKRRRDDFSFNHPLPDDWPAKLGYKWSVNRVW